MELAPLHVGVEPILNTRFHAAQLTMSLKTIKAELWAMYQYNID